jgi:ribokinase
MTTPTIASIGSIVVDIVIYTPRVPLTGENFVAHSFHIGPGGKGANAAAAVAKIGAHSLMIGAIGDDDFGKTMLSGLQKEHVDCSALKIDSKLQTGVAFIMVNDQRENTIQVVMGGNDHVNADYVKEALAAHAKTLSAILVDFEIPEDGVAAAVRFGRDHNIPVIVDAGPPRPYAPETWRDCTILTPNEHETAAMVGYAIDEDDDAIRAARELLAHGPKAVVLKRGKRGALLLTADDLFLMPVYAVEARDTTGAGDAFTAMFTVAMLEGKPLRDCVRYGNAAGAIAATRIGTMPALPTRNEVEQFLASRG